MIIYGRVVDGINYQSNQDTGRVDSNGKIIVGSSWGINGNVWGTSFFGVKGTEGLAGDVTGDMDSSDYQRWKC